MLGVLTMSLTVKAILPVANQHRVLTATKSKKAFLVNWRDGSLVEFKILSNLIYSVRFNFLLRFRSLNFVSIYIRTMYILCTYTLCIYVYAHTHIQSNINYLGLSPSYVSIIWRTESVVNLSQTVINFCSYIPSAKHPTDKESMNQRAFENFYKGPVHF